MRRHSFVRAHRQLTISSAAAPKTAMGCTFGAAVTLEADAGAGGSGAPSRHAEAAVAAQWAASIAARLLAM